MAARSRAQQVERELDRIYAEITRIKKSLRGKKRALADEIESRMYAGEMLPSEVLRELRKLASSSNRRKSRLQALG